MRQSDFRSDTVTRPDGPMRAAMAAAEVGDDVLGDDYTVQRLEAAVAALAGFEAGLFMPSGTMGNQVALHVHGRPGDELLADPLSHVFNFEGAGAARFSGLQVRAVDAPGGVLDPVLLEAALRDPADDHEPRSRIVVEENSANLRGGAVVGPEAHDRLAAFCRDRALVLHVDGARLWNSAVAAGVPPARLLAGAASAMLSISKGLGAPVGSLLVGSREFIKQARRARKAFGGGMRQVGILAAAGLVALEGWERRLAEDHGRARCLAGGLDGLPGLLLDPREVATNMVYLAVAGGPAAAGGLVAALGRDGVRALALGGRIRLVTHRDIGDEDVDRAVRAFRAALGQGDRA